MVTFSNKSLHYLANEYSMPINPISKKIKFVLNSMKTKQNYCKTEIISMLKLPNNIN
jgi:hypothetical protein